MHVEAIKQAVVEALEEIKAADITVLDVRQLTSLFDYMIIASAGSTRQTKALPRRNHRPRDAAGGARLLQPRAVVGRNAALPAPDQLAKRARSRAFPRSVTISTPSVL